MKLPLRNKLLLIACAIAAAMAACLSTRPRTILVPSEPLDLVLSRSVQFDVEKPGTLDGVMDACSNAIGRRVVLDWPELRSHGIVNQRATVPITAGTMSGNAREVISRALKDFATSQHMPDPAPAPAFQLLGNGSLYVSLDGSGSRSMRVYDVHDLLSDSFWRIRSDPDRVSQFEHARLESIASFISGRANCEQFFVVPPGAVTYIEMIDYFNRSLIVTTTSEKHRHIERILAALRRLNTVPAQPDDRLP